MTQHTAEPAVLVPAEFAGRIPGVGEAVYVPVSPGNEVEARRTERGEVVLFAYTTRSALAARCGVGQRSARMHVGDVVALQSLLPDTVLVAVDAVPPGPPVPGSEVREREPLAPAEHVRPLTEVWLPSWPVPPGAAHIKLDLFAFAEGEPPVLPAYRRLEDLYEACGPHQAAVLVQAGDLPRIAEEAGAGEVRFDVPLSPDLRHTQPVLDWSVRPLCAEPAPEHSLEQDSRGTIVAAPPEHREGRA